MPYSTAIELQDYATARGYTLVKDADVLLTLANDWIETLSFKGEKTDPAQLAMWPRKGVCVFGYDIDDSTVPDAILSLIHISEPTRPY